MINKIDETFKDIYNAVDVMEAAINEQRAEIKRLRHVEEIDQLLIKELLGITEELRKESYEAKDIALKYEDRYFVALVERDETRRERDEARRVLKAIVEEFVQHEQAINPFYPATPKHECEFSWSPERGKCDACKTWGDYVLICHPLWETDEEETL